MINKILINNLTLKKIEKKGRSNFFTLSNNTKIRKKERDKVKKEFALKNGFKIFYIWENEINNNDFSALDKIKKEIKNVEI